MLRSPWRCGWGLSREKYHGSLPAPPLYSGMNTCGWRRSISYSAVVPDLACPTMKKSGIRRSTARSPGDCTAAELIGVRKFNGGCERRYDPHTAARGRLQPATPPDAPRQIALHRHGALPLAAVDRDTGASPAPPHRGAVSGLDLARGDRPLLRL